MTSPALLLNYVTKTTFLWRFHRFPPVTAPILSSAFRSLWSTSGEPKSSQPQIGPYRQFSSSLARGAEKAVYRSLGLTFRGQFRKNHLVCAHSMKYWRDGNLSVLAASLLRSVSQWVLARLQRSTSQALLVKFKESLPFSKRQVWEAASLLASLRVKIQTGKLCVELRLVLGHIQVSARINQTYQRQGASGSTYQRQGAKSTKTSGSRPSGYWLARHGLVVADVGISRSKSTIETACC